MISYILDVYEYFVNLSLEGLLRVFWLFIFTDFPRYICMDIYILFFELFGKSETRQDKNFLTRLINNPPLVSVIIPSLNEAETLPWTVRSLKEQSYKNIEMIIVDDGSTDNTVEVCSKLKKFHKDLRFLRMAERSGKSAALNYGLGFAKGEYVVFVDSDTTFDRTAIYNIIAPFADPKVGGVSGNLRPRNADLNLITTLQTIEYLFVISIGRRIRAHFNILPIVSGAFGAFKMDLIQADKIGGHEPGPGNDSDLTIRVRKQGYKIRFAPEAICLTNVPERPLNLFKQRSRWDRNIIKNRVRKHKDVYNPFTKHFKAEDVFSFVDAIFFHVAVGTMTVVYLVDISLNMPALMPFILLINLCLYIVFEAIELLIAVLLSKRWEDLKLAIYIPLFNPFKIVLKMIRVIAYMQEIFLFSSFKDPFAPPKVRKNMIRW